MLSGGFLTGKGFRQVFHGFTRLGRSDLCKFETLSAVLNVLAGVPGDFYNSLSNQIGPYAR
jgi:hypothetical protein